MKLHVSHVTRYDYSTSVSLSPHLLYLRPRETSRLRLDSFRCEANPSGRFTHVLDPHDNELTWLHLTSDTSTLEIRTTSDLETHDANPFDFILKAYAVPFPFAYEPVFDFALGPYLAPPFDTTQTKLREWLDAQFADRPTETVPFLAALNTMLFQTLRYQRREETGIQPSLTTLALGSGACRDYAVLFVELCRTFGLAARFVSGYLFAPDGDNDRTIGAMHAWSEVYLPGAGWKGLDPTHGIWCDDRFVPVAHAAQAESVNPVQGSYFSPRSVSSKLTTTVVVERRA